MRTNSILSLALVALTTSISAAPFPTDVKIGIVAAGTDFDALTTRQAVDLANLAERAAADEVADAAALQALSDSVHGGEIDERRDVNSDAAALQALSDSIHAGENDEKRDLNSDAAALQALSDSIHAGEADEKRDVNDDAAALQALSDSVHAGEQD